MKTNELQKQREGIVKDGIAHIVYEAESIYDIIHPFSEEGNELLSDEFISFLEKNRAIIPKKASIVLEIGGKSMTEAEKKRIDSAVWFHFCRNMTAADIKAKACVKRVALFLLFTVLSAILLFAVINESDDVIINLAYVPFWFFGYRVLIYLIMDCRPLWNDRRWYRSLASLKIIFTEDGQKYEKLTPGSIREENSTWQHETENEVKYNRQQIELEQTEGLTELGCTVKSLDNLLLPRKRGREGISPELAGYLRQAEAFFSPKCRITFTVRGKEFTQEEQAEIRKTLRNQYSCRMAAGETERRVNLRRIHIFLLMVILSAVLIAVFGKRVDVAQKEFILVLFWFFADYLLEFILISHNDIRRRIKMLENCMQMKVRFVPGDAGEQSDTEK